MADNTQINVNATAGDFIATDDIAGVKYPRSKITLGADGVNDGDVSMSNPLPISGNVAHDSVDAGNPIKIGGKASATEPAAVAANDRVDAYFDQNGYLYVCVNGNVSHGSPDTGKPVLIGGTARSAYVFVSDGDRVSATFTTAGAIISAGQIGFTIGCDAMTASETVNNGAPASQADWVSNVGGYASVAPPAAVDDGDRVNVWCDLYGRFHVNADAGVALKADRLVTTAADVVTEHVVKFGVIDTSVSVDLVAAVVGKRIRVISLMIAAAAGVTIRFQSNALTNLTGAMTIGTNIQSLESHLGLFQTLVGEKLNIVLGAAVQVSGCFTYIEI